MGKSKFPPAGDSVNSAAEAMLQRLVQQVEPAGDSVNSAAEAMLQRLVEEFVSGKKVRTKSNTAFDSKG